MNDAPKKGMGCWLKGCLLFLLILGMGLCLTAIGGYFLYRKAHGLTSATPAALPVEQASAAQYDEIQQRIKTFADSLDKGQPGRFELTARDLNTLIAMTPGLKDLRGRAYVTIENSRIVTQASFPIKDIPGFSGRFVNASVGLHLSLHEGRIHFHPESIEIGGQPFVSQSILKSFAEGFEEGFVNQIHDHPEVSKLFSKIQSIEVTGDRLVLVPAPFNPFSSNPGSPTPEPQGTEEPPHP